MTNKIFRIGLDIDGVLADFAMAWHNLYPEINPRPNTWYFDLNIGKRFKTMRNDGTIDDFYLNIKPLINPEDLLFEPYCYITSRPVSKEITEKWLDINGFPKKRVISLELTQSKVEAAKESGIEIFVDDFYDNFVELNNSGITTYLYSQPWNEEYDVGHLRLNSLKDIPLLKQ